MKRLLALIVFAYPLLAAAQEAADKGGRGNFYFLGIGLVIFLAVVGVYSVIEKVSDALEAKRNRAEEETRKLRIENDEREAKLKSENVK